MPINTLSDEDKRRYAHMQNEAILQAAYNFGKWCAKNGYTSSANPHPIEERRQLEAWGDGYFTQLRKIL